MIAAGWFLVGAFVELCQLLLVFAGAAFAVGLAAPVRSAHDVVLALGFFAAYAPLALIPARDLVAGWLGMIARRRPERYERRSEDLGRGAVALAGSIALLMVPSVSESTAEAARPFEAGFLAAALVVFGIGGAIPRLWFALVRPAAARRTDAVPEMLQQASRRGGRFVLCAVLGIGLGLAAVRLIDHGTAAAATPATATAASTGTSASTTPHAERPSPPAPDDELFVGQVCRTVAPDCPATRTIDLVAAGAGEIAFTLGQMTELHCAITLGDSWPVRTSERKALIGLLAITNDGPPRDPEPITWDVVAGQHLAFTIAPPDAGASCLYEIELHYRPPGAP